MKMNAAVNCVVSQQRSSAVSCLCSGI